MPSSWQWMPDITACPKQLTVREYQKSRRKEKSLNGGQRLVVHIDHLTLTFYVETFRPRGTRKPRGPLRASPLRPSRCQGGAASASPPLAKPRHHQRHPPRFWQGSSLWTKKYCFRVNCSGTRVAMAHKQWAAIGVLRGNCLAPRPAVRGTRCGSARQCCGRPFWLAQIHLCGAIQPKAGASAGERPHRWILPSWPLACVLQAGRGNAARPPLRTADSVGAPLLDRCTWH